MIETLLELDTQVFLLFNGMHHPLLDTFMYCFSSRWVWVPLYMVAFLVIMHFYGWKAGLILFVCAVGAVALSDQACATLIRPMVARLRPANPDNPISDLVHIVNGYRGGRYGFPSCHAANTFAFATIMTLTLPTKRLMIGLYSWALINCYSRIYLGVHYPGDLAVGALIGICSGIVFYGVFVLCIQTMLIEKKRTIRINLSFILPKSYERANFHIADLMIFTGLLIVLGILIYSAALYIDL